MEVTLNSLNIRGKLRQLFWFLFSSTYFSLKSSAVSLALSFCRTILALLVACRNYLINGELVKNEEIFFKNLISLK